MDCGLRIVAVCFRTLQIVHIVNDNRMAGGFASLCMFGRARSKTSVENSIAVVGVKKALLIGNICTITGFKDIIWNEPLSDVDCLQPMNLVIVPAALSLSCTITAQYSLAHRVNKLPFNQC